ncbi:TIR domain-containing protein [Thalassoglobus sp.]|uniref:TIR domain-containing protein n=1 Tax=Thalassoglobus sp. TaxID=2795869 RepID=UPI003AA8FED4
MSLVFISYSHTDSSHADAIVTTLEELGVETFRDVKDIEWGQAISTKVREGLESAAAIIVIVSPGSLKSQWVAYEVGFGTGTGKRILPYLTHPSLDQPGFMADLTYVKSIDDIRDFFATNTDWHSPNQTTANETKRTATLSDMQVEYLMTISKPCNEGMICGGIDEQTGRDVALYQDALERFQELGLMRYNGGGYKLTPNGWKLVDQLWALAIVDALEVDKYQHESKIAEAVGLTDGQTEMEEVHRLIDALKERGFVNSTRTRSGVSAALTQAGATHRKHRPLEL